MNKEIITINGLTIREDSVYVVTHKPDPSAPSGFIKEGATKLPSPHVTDTFQCGYVVINKSDFSGLWDTGFYKESPCYRGRDLNEVEEIVANLRKYIVEPYERVYGRGVLDHQNDDFWGKYWVTVSEGTIANTADPAQLLSLYIALRTFKLTPKGSENEHMFNRSQFCVVDKNSVVSKREEESDKHIQVIFDFHSMLTDNKELLLKVLRFSGFNSTSSTISDNTLKASFLHWVTESSSKADNVNRFIKAMEIANDDKKSDILYIYDRLVDLNIKGKISRHNGEYRFESESLGMDLKEAAKNLHLKSDLRDLKAKLLMLD